MRIAIAILAALLCTSLAACPKSSDKATPKTWRVEDKPAATKKSSKKPVKAKKRAHAPHEHEHGHPHARSKHHHHAHPHPHVTGPDGHHHGY